MLRVLDKTAEFLVGNGRFPRVAAAGGALLIASGALAVQERNEPDTVFLQDFSVQGRCLDNTPFDVTRGKLTTDSKGDTTVLTVSTAEAPQSIPETLHFQVNHRGIFGTVELVFSDSATAEYVIDRGCPGQPDGY